MNQDWDEAEALRASLREHMAEIKRLNDCLTWEQHRVEHIGTHGPGCAEWGPKHYECLLRTHKALKAQIERNADSSKTSDVPETNFGNMAQVVDSKEADHIPGATKMVATINQTETVEPWPWPTSQESRQVEPVTWLFQHEETGLTECVDVQQVEWGFERNNSRWQKIGPLYTAPPKREPLTDEDIDSLRQGEQRLNFVTLREFRVIARAIERAHGIGGEE